MAMDLKKPSAVLFDMDGTLFDTETLKAKALSQTVAQFGGYSSPNNYKDVMGSTWQIVREHFLRKANVSVTECDFDAVFRSIYLPLIQGEAKMRKGAFSYILSLKENVVPLGIVSSASAWMMKEIIAGNRLEGIFEVCLSNEDVKLHKPHPEAYLLALSKINMNAKDALVFEDSETGIEAGAAAGCTVVAIRHEFNTGHDFSKASYVINSFEESSREF